MQSVIVCCGTNGRCVVFGEVESEPVTGEPITIHHARMVLYWPIACGGLFGLAARGPKDGLRMTEAVAKTATEAVRQWISVTEVAAEGLRNWQVYSG